MARQDATLTEDGTAGPFDHSGGQLHYSVTGTFGSGTVSVQSSIGGGFVQDATGTADFNGTVLLPEGAQVQFVLSGSSSPDIDIVVRS